MYTGKQKSKRRLQTWVKCLLFDGLPEMYHAAWSNNEGGNSMNKAELTAAIVKKTGFTKKDAEKAAKEAKKSGK